MYPYFRLFWVNISLMAIGIILSFIVFLITAWNLTKKNNQDFLKLFYRLPARLIVSYLLWRYISFALETWTYFPSSFSAFLSLLSPQWFKFHFVGLLLATWICLWFFFAGIKRTENKKIWVDIFFFSGANALILLWIFLTLWDNVIGLPTESAIGIRALTDNSALTKFDSVYPVWLFLSFWVLAVHFIISFANIIFKKNWLGLRWIVWILIVLNVCFFFQSYPRYWIISMFNISFDAKQYFSRIMIAVCIITYIKREKKRFY